MVGFPVHGYRTYDHIKEKKQKRGDRSQNPHHLTGRTHMQWHYFSNSGTSKISKETRLKTSERKTLNFEHLHLTLI